MLKISRRIQPYQNHLYFLTGASAFVQLNQFKEAVTWCEKGLAVSFTGFNMFYIFFYHFHLFSILGNAYNIYYKDISHLRYD